MQAALSLYCSVFFFLFSQCHATIHLQPASVLKQQITVWALFVSGTTKCLLLIQALCLPVTLSSHAHCLLPSSAPCYIWDAETQKEKVQRSRPEVRCCPQPSWPNHCQEIMERSCQKQEAFCHLCLATWLSLLFEDEVMLVSWPLTVMRVYGKLSLPPLYPMMLKCQTRVRIFYLFIILSFRMPCWIRTSLKGFGSLGTQQEESHSSILPTFNNKKSFQWVFNFLWIPARKSFLYEKEAEEGAESNHSKLLWKKKKQQSYYKL